MLFGFAILSLIGIPLILGVGSILGTQVYTTSEDRLFSETMSLTIINGTAVSYYTNDLDEGAEGVYNISLPFSSFNQDIEMNESVAGFRLIASYHHEISSINSQTSLVTHGYQWTLMNQYATLSYSTPRYTLSISGGISYAMTQTDTYSFDKDAVSILNNTNSDLECEFILGAISTAPGEWDTPSDIQNATVLFSIGLSFILIYERPVASVSWLIIAPAIVLAVIGLSAIVVLAKRMKLF